jgi:cation diffusion facilitator CzcD-associated flavoprotein CzcO
MQNDQSFRSQKITKTCAFFKKNEEKYDFLIFHRTNIPKEIMQIPDFPFRDPGGSSFPSHTIIREYLMNYAEHFNLYSYIKVNFWIVSENQN